MFRDDKLVWIGTLGYRRSSLPTMLRGIDRELSVIKVEFDTQVSVDVEYG
jgi:hypothetical protein